MAKVDLKDIGCALALLLGLGILLLLLRTPLSEGFQSGASRCGVGMSPCPGSLKCINGFCAKTDPIRAYETHPVPMLPDGESYPYM